ncbi:MAG: hypothetical protein HC800_18620 [Phormidesmis sp. RL_2_1]|nr:hypothetical protein [Phormidesmis sp. RL_2_1]
MTRRQIRKLTKRAMIFFALIVGLHGIGKAIAYDVDRAYSASYASKVSAENIASIGIGITPNIEDIPCDFLKFKAENGEDVELVASVMDDTGHYQMWLYENAGMIEYTVSEVNENGLCGLAYTPYDDEFTNRIPLDIARELMLQFNLLKADIAGGLEAYRQQTIENFTVCERQGFPWEDEDWCNEPVQITSVDKWVFDQLGIVLPEDTYIVRDIDDGWDYEYEPGATTFPDDSNSQ